MTRPIGQINGRVHLGLQAHGVNGTAPKPPKRPIARLLLPPEQAATAVELPKLIGQPRKIIKKLVRGAKLWLLIDDSGSMYFWPWGDPAGIRYEAARTVMELLRTNGGGEASVVHFGGSAPVGLVTPLTEVKSGQQTLDRALTIPYPNLGWTDLAAGLERVLEGMPILGDDEAPVVVVISDGIQAVDSRIHDAVKALPPGCVHMLLVDRSSGCDAATEAAWRSAGFGSFARLRTFDTREMAIQIAEVFADALGLQLAAPKDSK